MDNVYARDAKIYKALGDENRLRILELLKSGEKCGNALLSELDIGQPTLSHHMKLLCESGIVNGVRCGKMICYSISDEGTQALKNLCCKYLKLV